MHLAFLSLQSNVNVAHILTGLILGLHPAKERRRYKVTPSLIGWAQSKDQPYIHMHSFNGRRWSLQNTIGQQSSSDTLLGYLSRNNIFIKLATSIRNHDFITRGVVSHIKHSTTNEKRTVPHYLNQCWPRSVTHICVTGGWRWGARSRWVRSHKIIPGFHGSVTCSMHWLHWEDDTYGVIRLDYNWMDICRFTHYHTNLLAWHLKPITLRSP